MLQGQAALPIIGAIVLLVLYIARAKLTAIEGISKNVPWVGKGDGFLADFKARIDSMKSSALEISDAGYKKFSRSGTAFMLPGIDAHSVIIPGADIKWLLDQPDNVLSAQAMQRELIQSDHSFLDPDIARNTYQEVTIRRDLTRSIGDLIPDIEDELNLGADKYWGVDTHNWNEINVMDTVRKMVTRTSNRIFVGTSLCRNDDFIDNCCKYTNDIAISSNLIKFVPELLKPLLAPLMTLPTRWHLHRINTHLIPLLTERRNRMKEVGEKGLATLPWNDFAIWYMREALKNRSSKERSLGMISKRIMSTNFAAIHTSTFTATNIFVDLYSSPRANEFVSALREEITSVLAANGGAWDKFALAKLVRVDSAVRESMRISIFQTQGLFRLVVDPKGVTMDSGLHLPQGTRVGTSTYSIHHDESIYRDASTYDPFRFSREREEKSTSVLKGKNLAAVTTSDTFLSFGHGRHACPGRFFATTEMKLLLAYIVLNYDVQPLQERPRGLVSGGFRLPPSQATLFVKRRVF